MYAFESTNDFGHKTGYVAEVSTARDLNGTDEFYPLENPVEFDNLFVRFKSEIDNVIANGGSFDSQNLYICKWKNDNDGVVSSNYLATRVYATQTQIRVYLGSASSRTSTLSDYVTCSASDYQNAALNYNYGRIYLVRCWYRNTDQTAQTMGTPWEWGMLGRTKALAGTYNPNSGSYGAMVYASTGYTLPQFIPLGTPDQCGFPLSIENVQNQPETAGKFDNYPCAWRSSNKHFCSASGEYDPDPEPPTPPGPTPSSDPNDRDPEPNNKEDMGGGPHTPTSDPIPVPGLPPIGPLSGGACRAFVLDETEFADFNSRLHDPTAWQAIKQYFNDPMDFLVGCVCLPFFAPYFGYQYPKFGTYVWPVSYRVCRDQFKEIDCGSVLCSAYYGSCFDYSPYTKIQLWLPFIGFVQLDPDEVMEMQISVKYHVDCMTGDCVAYVSTGSSVMQPRVLGIYNGNCGMQTPMARTSYDNVISCAFGLVGAAASAGAGYVGGGAALGAMAESGAKEASVAAHRAGLNAHLASRLASSTMSAVAGAKTTSIKSGTTGGALGFMGVLTPYLLIHTPRQSKPSNYIGMKGYPSNIGGIVGDFTGYVEFSDVRLNVPALENEVDEIYELLKGGVLI